MTKEELVLWHERLKRVLRRIEEARFHILLVEENLDQLLDRVDEELKPLVTIDIAKDL